jgi:hypothetical protein
MAKGRFVACCGWVTGIGILNRTSIRCSLVLLVRYSFSHLLPVFPALALDVVRSAFHALLIAAIPVAVGWFVTNHFLHLPRQMKDQEDERDSRPGMSQQQSQTTRPVHADPPLELADLALSVSHSSEHEIAVLSPVPRVPLPPKRVSRKLSRPLTASILDERRNLLPTSPSSSSLTDISPIGTPATDNESSWPCTSPDPLPGESVTGDKTNAEIGILPDIIVESTVFDDHSHSLAGEFFIPGGFPSTRLIERRRSITDCFRFLKLPPDGRHSQ